MARISNAEYQIRLLETDKLCVRLVDTHKVRAALMKKYGVAESTANQWIAKVKKRWREDVEHKNAQMPEIREARRSQMRAMLQDVIAQANSKQTTMRDRGGKVILDKTGKPIMQAAPDLKASLAAMSQLRDLDALDQPKAAHLLVTNTTKEDGMSQDEMDFFVATNRFATPDELEAWKNRKQSH